MSAAPKDPSAILSRQFEIYLLSVYGARAGSLPTAQRDELRQAYYGAARMVTDRLAGPFVRNGVPTRGEIEDRAGIDAECNAYGVVRIAQIDIKAGRFAGRG